MSEVTLKVPQEILLDLKSNESSFSEYLRKLVAVDLYTNKKVSLGYCAILAEMAKEDFIKFLGENQISIFSFEDEKEFLDELANA